MGHETMEHRQTIRIETQHAASPRNLQRTVHEHLETHRMTYREFINVLTSLGVKAETNKHGSGHIILRHGEKSAAVVSHARKISESWQPRAILNVLRRLGIHGEDFLVAATDAGIHAKEEYKGSPNVVEI
jgi:predicted RNA binding protein YcfA (HicA-like mRNA interferase family)